MNQIIYSPSSPPSPALVGVLGRMVATPELQLGGNDPCSSAIAMSGLNEWGEPAVVVLLMRRRSWLEFLIRLLGVVNRDFMVTAVLWAVS